MEINDKNMTQEEKELVIKDLCGRLPYGVIVQVNDGLRGTYDRRLVQVFCDRVSCSVNVCNPLKECICIDSVKPYLRPLSSMTKEEEEECVLHDLGYWDSGKYEDEESGSTIYIGESFQLIPSTDTFDYVDRKGFDYRGLIKRGLALEAPEGMYNN